MFYERQKCSGDMFKFTMIISEANLFFINKKIKQKTFVVL